MSLSARKVAEALGLSHTAINNAVKRGRIQREPDGGFDADHVRAALAQNTDVLQQQRGAPQRAAAAEGTSQPDKTSLHEAQRAREWLRVRKEKIAIDIAEHRLIDGLEAERAWGEMVVSAQQKLLSIPGLLAPRLAAESDQAECEVLLRSGIVSALNELSEYRPPHE